MSHLALVAFAALTAALACAAPTPPEPSAPEVVTSEPAPPSTDPPAAEAAAETKPEAAAPVEATLLVREQRVDCQGEGATRCLQVRQSESEPWRNLYAPIEGFDYEESNAYELRVAVTQTPHPPADAPSLRYRLIEVISKRKVKPPAAGK